MGVKGMTKMGRRKIDYLMLKEAFSKSDRIYISTAVCTTTGEGELYRYF